MPKIIVVDNSVYVTGAIKSIVTQAKELTGQYQFEFAMDSRGGAAQYVRDAGYKVHDFRYLEISKNWRVIFYPFALLENSIRLSRLMRSRGAQIIHVNDLYNQTGLLAKALSKKLRVVHHVRLTDQSYLRPVYPALARSLKQWADSIVFVSYAAGKRFLDSPRANLIYDTLGHEPSHAPKRIGSELINCRYLYVGNYVRGKGQNFALEAFSRIAPNLSGATLRFVGYGVNGELDNQFVDELQARAARVDLGDRVQFDGPVTDIELTMKESDVVVNLSESESFSMVCLEALAYGLPLVASDCGGPRELVQNEVNGMLVANRSVEQAAEAMYRLATQHGLAAHLGSQAPRSVSEKFSKERAAKRLAAVYEALLAQ